MDKDLEFMLRFATDHLASQGMTKELADNIEQLIIEYRLSSIQDNCSAITADFGFLGSIVIREIEQYKPTELEYKWGHYDYISVKTKSQRNILYTDYENVEPYNRQGGLYCDGSRFEDLGQPINHDKYREYDITHIYPCNISFGIWGFGYNNYWYSVSFGMIIKTELVNEFITKLKQLIGK